MDINKLNKTMNRSILKINGSKLSQKMDSADIVKKEKDLNVFEAAKSFEGLFIQNLMNEMMKSTGDEFMGKGLSGDIFKGLFVEKMSEQLVQGRGMGLTSLIYDYFEKSGMIKEQIDPLEKK